VDIVFGATKSSMKCYALKINTVQIIDINYYDIIIDHICGNIYLLHSSTNLKRETIMSTAAPWNATRKTYVLIPLMTTSTIRIHPYI
jgi:hypothetical protein